MIEALGTIAMQRTQSSAGWFSNLGGLSWSEGPKLLVDMLSLIFTVTMISSDNMQSDLQQKVIQMRRDIELNTHNYLSNTPGGVQQASASQPPDPRLEFSLIFPLQVGCCVGLHGAGAEHKTTSFPNPCR
jgi:hypothetical protein